MSHLKQRTETNCLNCGTEVSLKYCGNCGQENIDPDISFWHLVTHFFNDFTHFDGKFFTTLKRLITKPGVLSLAFVQGERMRYLDPIRMYIFTSFLFFLIFFSFSKFEGFKGNITYDNKNMEEINQLDSATFSEFTKAYNKGTPMSRDAFKVFVEKDKNETVFNAGNKYRSLSQFDSLNKRGEIKGNWAEKMINRKQLEIEVKYHNDQDAYLKALWDSVSHSLPQMFFISLPLFALCLKLLYVRHKKIYFTQHVIYAVHLYIFTFLVLFGFMLNGWLNVYIGDGLSALFIFSLIIWLGIYEYKAMRKFYRQRRLKTIIKFLLATFLRFVIILILFFIFTAISFYKT